MDELVELLWDRGTVVAQGQSSRPPTTTTADVTTTGYSSYKSPSFGDGAAEVKKMLINKDTGGGNPAQIIQFVDSPEPLLDPEFFSLPGTDRPECDGRVEAEDPDTDTGRVPWIHYPILDSSDHNLNPDNPPLPPPKTVPVKKPPHLHLEGGGLGMGLVNFSHFLRPVALAEATLQSAERLRSNEKASTSYNNSSVVINQSASTFPPPPPPPANLSAVLKPQMPLEAVAAASLQPAELTEREKLERVQKVKEREKMNVRVVEEVPPASVCSINVDPKMKLKRKSLEEDNTTNSDEDVQDESVGLTRSSTSKSKGIKRGRTAEVHNLSERRRRDRINEKMRALQELIPNCNKVDKASMLDEAIEYLKTLQLQVQMMMMMGNGMCIPPMMVPGPPGLHHHHMPLAAAYPQMGMGMGLSMGMNMNMGMGYGMVPPMNFMPVINGPVFPFDNGIPPPAPTSFGPQVERRHGNSSNPAQSGEVGVNRTDTSSNGETVKSATKSWS